MLSLRFIALALCTYHCCFNALADGQQQHAGGYSGYVEQQKPKAEASVKENPYQVNNGYAGIPLPSGYNSVNLPAVNYALLSSGQMVKNMNYQSINAPPASNGNSYVNIPTVQPAAVSFGPSSTIQPSTGGDVAFNAMLSGGGYAGGINTAQPAVNYGYSSIMPPMALKYLSINQAAAAAASGSGSQMKIDQPRPPPGYVVHPSTIRPSTMSTQPPAPAVEGYGRGYAAAPGSPSVSAAASSSGIQGQASAATGSQAGGHAAQPGMNAAGGQSQAASSGASSQSNFGYGASSGASGQGMAASGGSQTDSIGYAAAPGTAASTAGRQSGGQDQAASGGSQSASSFGYGVSGGPSMPGAQQKPPQPSGRPSEAAAYGTTIGYAQKPPAKLPAGGFGGYMALGSISQGYQSKTDYANVGGYAAPVVSTQPATFVVSTTEATAPCTASVSAVPDSSAVGGYAVGQQQQQQQQEIVAAVVTEKPGCTANVAKKLDQPIPTEPATLSTTTEKPTTTSTITTTTTTTTTMTEATKVTKPCVDNHRFCSFWKDQGECEKNPDYMKVNCAISCKTC